MVRKIQHRETKKTRNTVSPSDASIVKLPRQENFTQKALLQLTPRRKPSCRFTPGQEAFLSKEMVFRTLSFAAPE